CRRARESALLPALPPGNSRANTSGSRAALHPRRPPGRGDRGPPEWLPDLPQPVQTTEDTPAAPVPRSAGRGWGRESRPSSLILAMHQVEMLEKISQIEVDHFGPNPRLSQLTAE